MREILEDLADEDGKPLARSTWEEWRTKGTGPKCIKLPNGQLRIRRAEYERWLNDPGRGRLMDAKSRTTFGSTKHTSGRERRSNLHRPMEAGKITRGKSHSETSLRPRVSAAPSCNRRP